MATAVRGPMVTTVARPKLRRKNMFSVKFGFFMAFFGGNAVKPAYISTDNDKMNTI